MMTAQLRVGKWIIFSVCVALMPIIFSYVILKMQRQSADSTVLIGRGELLILVSALCAASLGDLLMSKRARPWAKLVCGGSTLLFLVMSSLLYAAIATTPATGDGLDLIVVRNVSLWLFILSLITCGSSVAVAEAS